MLRPGRAKLATKPLSTGSAICLPQGLCNYLCRFLRGKIKRQRGRKKEDEVVQWLTEHLIAPEYQKVLALQRRECVQQAAVDPPKRTGTHAKHETRYRIECAQRVVDPPGGDMVFQLSKSLEDSRNDRAGFNNVLECGELTTSS
jgi:hypothetical protein